MGTSTKTKGTGGSSGGSGASEGRKLNPGGSKGPSAKASGTGKPGK